MDREGTNKRNFRTETWNDLVSTEYYDFVIHLVNVEYDISREMASAFMEL